MAETKTKNKRASNTAKTPGNEYDNKREVKVYKLRQFEIVEVEKEKIDNIKNAVQNAKNNINKGAISSDVVLGLSTTFFGGFIGCIPDIVRMITSNALTLLIFFYFALILVAIILFFVYLSMQRKKSVDTNALIERIAEETDSISNKWVIPGNDMPENIPPNHLGGTSKQTDGRL